MPRMEENLVLVRCHAYFGNRCGNDRRRVFRVDRVVHWLLVVGCLGGRLVPGLGGAARQSRLARCLYESSMCVLGWECSICMLWV
jgi:hypothetical protein